MQISACREAIDNSDHSSLSSTDISKEKMDEGSQAAMEDRVVLVVANSRDDTVGLVDFLKSSFGSHGGWGRRVPAKDVKVHHCGSLEIVDTIPMKSMEGGRRSSIGLARRWISRNGLRRIVLKRNVIVICVLLCRLVNARGVFSAECEEWMEIFSLIFKPLKEAVRIFAKVEDNVDARRSVALFVEKHGILRNHIVYSLNDQNWVDLQEYRISDVVPFLMSNNFSEEDLKEEDLKFIWGSERVILFGKVGTGKSTLAQMLTLGRLESDPNNTPFVTSAGFRGATKNVTDGYGRGWYVHDTPGFGEPKSGGTIPSQEVADRIKNYVKIVEGTFAHYLFVVKGDRPDDWDRSTWKFLRNFLGDDIKHNLSIVVSGADEDWLKDNREALKEDFPWQGYNRDHIFAANFPADISADDVPPDFSDEDRQECNEELQKIRDKSLRKLESFLAGRKLTDRHCPHGKVNLQSEKFMIHIDFLHAPSQTSKFRHKGTHYLQKAHDLFSRSKAKLTERFIRDDPLDMPEKLTIQ